MLTKTLRPKKSSTHTTHKPTDKRTNKRQRNIRSIDSMHQSKKRRTEHEEKVWASSQHTIHECVRVYNLTKSLNKIPKNTRLVHILFPSSSALCALLLPNFLEKPTSKDSVDFIESFHKYVQERWRGSQKKIEIFFSLLIHLFNICLSYKCVKSQLLDDCVI